MNKYNYSTAHDICLLCSKCMQIPLFRKVVSTKVYSACGYTWENTNKLLGTDGWIGCKTGITDAAGPCYSGCYERNGHKVVVVVLESKSMEHRWVEVRKMVEWVEKRHKIYSDNLMKGKRI